jgi:hypothetical protein
MVTFTTAKGLYQVANSSYVGTWDIPTNSNWNVVDAALGQNVSIALAASPVILSQAQMQCSYIQFTGTLTANVAITFPQVGSPLAPITGSYTVFNNCAGSSVYTVTLKSTNPAGRVIGCIPGNAFDCITDGANFRYKNLPTIGTYMDFASNSYPPWVLACNVQFPYLYCDGSGFSAGQYPILAGMIGTTLPDCRGRARFSMDGGTGRLPLNGSVPNSLDGNTLFAGGGLYYHYIANSEVPELSVYDPTHAHTVNTVPHAAYYIGRGGGGGGFVTDEINYTTTASYTGVRVGQIFASAVPFGLQSPGMTQGLTFIRSA